MFLSKDLSLTFEKGRRKGGFLGIISPLERIENPQFQPETSFHKHINPEHQSEGDILKVSIKHASQEFRFRALKFNYFALKNSMTTIGFEDLLSDFLSLLFLAGEDLF